MKKALLLAVPVLMMLLFMSAGPVLATEEARGVYPNGSEDCYAGCLPPPGTYFINYNTYQWFDRINDKDGHEIPIDLKAQLGATVFRFIKGTGCKILGADWYWHVLIPVQYLHVSNDVFSGTKKGLGNLVFNPIILGWHFGDWHMAFGMDINTPAPGWDKDDNVRIGTGYWNVEPLFAFTYLNKNGFEVGAKFMYDYNFENQQTSYKTGQEFHVDAAVAQKFKNGFLVSLVGYYWDQITKDKDHGNKVAYSDKGRVWALGPMVRYDYKNMWFLLKYYHEMDARNTLEGEAVWFKWFYAF